ncbi:unnamed protein product [Heterobilharzia americana]|nr:unnamed protein product [Heterobilharzia americana]
MVPKLNLPSGNKLSSIYAVPQIPSNSVFILNAVLEKKNAHTPTCKPVERRTEKPINTLCSPKKHHHLEE